MKKKHLANNVVKGAVWGILSKLVLALVRFLTIPLLVGYYGKFNYGLITLAFSLNAYLRLMDMGLGIGAIRFFSIWIAAGDNEKLEKASQSSMLLYGIIGVVNSIIFLFLAWKPSFIISNITSEQTSLVRWMLYLLAASSIFNWISNLFSQLLTAYGELSWLNKVSLLGGIVELLTAFAAKGFGLSIQVYFLLYTLTVIGQIPINLIRLRKFTVSLQRPFKFAWEYSIFREVFVYSMAIFAMGVFQVSANAFRPLILGRFAPNGISTLTEFRVIDTISSLIIMLAGSISQALLPSVAKLYAEGNTLKIEDLIYRSTKYMSIFICLLVFGIASNAKGILSVYMGTQYTVIHLWLSLAAVTLLSLHSAPLGALVLASGKTKPLAIMSAIACLLNLSLVAVLANKIGIGAAVLGYLVYQVMMSLFYYFYYTKRVLELNGKIIFIQYFLPSLLVGIISGSMVYAVYAYEFLKTNLMGVLLGSTLFFTSYIGLTVFFILNGNEIRLLKVKARLR